MPRSLTSNMLSEIAQPTVRPALFFQGDFIGSTIRLWTGIGDVSWNSQTWLGNGWLQFPQGGEESVEMSANSLELVLMGVPLQVVSLILNQGNSGSNGTLYLAMLDTSNAVIADPYPEFVGRFDTATIAESSEGSQVSITYESRLVDFDRAREFRYTHELQKFWFPNDLGFQYVAALQDWSGYWGTVKQKPKKMPKHSTRQRHTR